MCEADVWHPTKIVRQLERPLDTSMGTTRVLTDQGDAWLKAMGNREGLHALACELIGSRLAKWIGLSVPDFSVIPVPSDACFELPHNARVAPGPGFVSKHVPGHSWGGSPDELRLLTNPNDVSSLVVFDTWVRNCDRYPPEGTTRKPNYDNVRLANDGKRQFRLLAIDHSHCFTCGRDLSDKIGTLDHIQDDRVYGLFPAFESLLSRERIWFVKTDLRSLKLKQVEEIVHDIPREWEVSDSAKGALVRHIHGRAGFVADRIEQNGDWPRRSGRGDA